MSASSSGQGPRFEPRKRVLREIADFLGSIAEVLRNASTVWETLSELGIARKKLVAVVLSALLGAGFLPAGPALLGISPKGGAAIAAALQLPWMILAARSPKETPSAES